MAGTFIGVSGWNCAGWRGVFYPDDLPRRYELALAARQFNAIEIGSTWTGGTLMQNDRIAALRRMLEKNPDDTRVRFGLAAEYEKAANWQAAAEELQRYLAATDDEGNAWGRLGHALRQLGRTDEARTAYNQGIEAANRHGHPTMAMEFEEILAEW